MPAQPQPDPGLTGTYAQPLAPVPAGERFAPGALLAGRYRIVAALGRGGMGEVYRADDLTLGQPVALKFLPPHLAADPDRLARFRQEVATARRVSHPHVCRVYDIAEHAGQPFLTMEFVDGEDLASLLKRVGRLPEEKGAEVARQLCSALAAVHDQGLLHRDLKPANVMLDGRGKVRLTDFGLAAAAQDLSATEVRSGTPLYQAPEQLAGKEVTARSDVFALGLVLYEVFTGKRAFPTPDRSTPPSKPSSLISGLSPAVERVILRCLEPDPDHRPASATNVLVALPGGDPLAAALAAGQTPSPELVAAAGGEGRLRPATAAICMAAILAGLVVWLFVYPRAMLFGRLSFPKLPEVLASDAREVIQAAGYDTRRENAYGFDHDAEYLEWVTRNDRSPNRWDRLVSPQPAAVYFWYRQSPVPLMPGPNYLYLATLEPGRITPHDPPPIVPGMITVRLDAKGRLIAFHAVPPEERSPVSLPGETDWAPCSPQRGLTRDIWPKTRTPATSRRCMRTSGWHGLECSRTRPRSRSGSRPPPSPGSRSISRSWPRGPAGIEIPTTPEAIGSNHIRAVYYLVLLVVAVILAPRNLRRGRADLTGAGRLAGVVAPC